ncbi:hypothetical protein [Rhizobium sp. UGM030330-04]|uniref:Nmad2 family putative nucleotide modification protein n=1 Tax=Rhizobium sp. UGM030330-04 TaxID=1378077 RepID=UPI000D9CE38C|nr:hypothetical protein [Rhizobium sp. UGM030330-04]PYG53014.1 hypothetical protein N434_04974 [Rhizobium sp. UGM030330-04]
MLIEPNSHLNAYTITRDFGFAPNPFHGLCTLATCKPRIRKSAKVDDWIMGIGGRKLRGVYRKCILLMKVSEKVSFQDYWDDYRYSLKKPVRNGSRVQMLGDNIYHKGENGSWIQEDSHHSNSDGTLNQDNLNRDTGRTDQMLVSNYFLYFGNKALTVDLDSIRYGGVRDYKKIILSDSKEARDLIVSMFREHRSHINMVVSDPCQFMNAHQRVDQGTGKIQ